MRDPKRIDEFCEELKEMWQQVPDWGFGQLISNLFGALYVQTGNHDPFYVEDDKMMELLKEVKKHW